MGPTETEYRIANSPMDYRRAHAILRENNIESKTRFPTVLAWRNDKVVGVMGTDPRKDMILAGPLAVTKDIKVPIFTALRLIEAYENVLKLAHVTEYWFWIDEENQRWLQSIGNVMDIGIKDLGDQDGKMFYKREMSWAAEVQK